MNKKYFVWAAAVIYSVLIFIGSSIPGDQIGLETASIDKLLHAIEYLILSLLIFASLKFSITIKNGTIFWLAAVGSSLYGLSDEIHQIFVPLREFDVLDIACNTSGSILGSYLMLRIANNVRSCL